MAGLDQDGDAPTGEYDGEKKRVREVTARSLKCPNCGAPWTLRGFANTKTVACAHCGSILDTTTPEWQIVEKVEHKRQTAPIWPLGQNARFGGKVFQLVGWTQRYVVVDGTRYSWEEHLFFSPYHGFRYLIYQDGHFQLVEPLPGFPEVTKLGATSYTATYEGTTYRHFTTGTAQVADVVGEFPWRVTRGEKVVGYDFVAPPLMLSCEESGSDVVWSRGTYMTRDEVVNAVAAPKRSIPFAHGVYPNQPNPWDRYKWLGFAGIVATLAVCLLSLVYVGMSQETQVLHATVPPKGAPVATPTPAPGETPAPATPGHHVYEIELGSRRDPATVEIRASAPVSNAWAYCDCALVDTVHEHAYPFAVEVSYYEGSDDGEHWSEGSQSDTVDLGAIPNGKYVLQVERGDDANVPLDLVIVRDVPLIRYPCCSLLLIIVFPLVVLIARSRFESARWAESDHAPGSS